MIKTVLSMVEPSGRRKMHALLREAARQRVHTCHVTVSNNPCSHGHTGALFNPMRERYSKRTQKRRLASILTAGKSLPLCPHNAPAANQTKPPTKHEAAPSTPMQPQSKKTTGTAWARKRSHSSHVGVRCVNWHLSLCQKASGASITALHR